MIDGNPQTMYHSNWYAVGIPDEVKFYFTQQAQAIKEIVYTPRISSLNGVWAKVSVSYATRAKLYVAIVGTGDVSLTTTKIYYPSNALGVYAVGYDGTRILVFPLELSVESLSNSSFTIQPNPFEDELTIVGNELIHTLIVYEALGKLVQQVAINASTGKIDTSKLQPGVYLLKITTYNGVYTSKVVKK
jgi:hypothetical protein